MFDKIEDKRTRKSLYGVLTKYFIASCRIFKLESNIYPEGIDKLFLIKNTLNLKEFIKTLCFILNRKLYVRV